MLQNNIMNELKKQKKTQLWLSFETKITSQDISQVVNGKKVCWPAWKRKIAKALEVPEQELFPGLKEGSQHAE